MMLTKTDFFQYALILLVVLWPAWVLVFALGRELFVKIVSLAKNRPRAQPARRLSYLPISADKPLPHS